MTRRLPLSRFERLALCLCTAFVAIAIGCSGSRTEGLDASKLPENVRIDYELFARRCSKCHSLARPLTAGIRDDDQWVMYVNRMRRQPGSGITIEDQDQILHFLRWHAAELRRRDAEKHTAPPPPSSSSSSSPPAPVEPPSPTTTTPAPTTTGGPG